MKDSIEIPIACIRCRKYGHHVTDCRKEEKAKKEKDKKEKVKMKIKQDDEKIKSVALQDLMTEAKMVKKDIKEIKEENPTDRKIDNDDDGDRQNFLSLIDRVIFQKWHTKITLVINKEFSLT